jgi:CopG family transcriptional regulator, nickel-responsive regulator
LAVMVRTTISLEPELLQKFEQFWRRSGYPSRSEAMRELIVDQLTAEAWEDDRGEHVATVTVTYDSGNNRLVQELLALQQACERLIISSLRVAVPQSHSFDILVMRGHSTKIKAFAENLRRIKSLHVGPIVLAAPRNG